MPLELIERLQREAKLLTQAGDTINARLAHRLADGLGRASAQHRIAADEAHRLGRRARSLQASPRDIVAFDIAQTAAVKRSSVVADASAQGARFLESLHPENAAR